MIRYVFKDDVVAIKNLTKADPQKVGESLAAISAAHGDRLKPADVVEAAQNRRSPLHKHFEWDDTKAAISHRRNQARELIRVIRVIKNNEEPQRAFLSVSDKGGTTYRPLEAVLSSADLQLRVTQQALRDLKAFENRYSELEDICDLVSVARERLQSRIQVTEGTEAAAAH